MYAIQRHAMRCRPRKCPRGVRPFRCSPRPMDAGPSIDMAGSSSEAGGSKGSGTSFASSVAGQAMLGSLGTVVVLALGG